MSAQSIYKHITQNNTKTLFLVLLFPVSLCVLLYAGMYIAGGMTQNVNSAELLAAVNDTFLTIVPLVVAGALVWMGISYFLGDKMMLGFAGATEITPDSADGQLVYRAVEHVARAAQLPMPKVFIVDDMSLNAFATGRSPTTASVAVTRGLIGKLKPLELEAVIAHELGHIGNRDVRLNMLIITGIGIFGLLADLFYPTRHVSDEKENAIGWGLWVALMAFSLLVAPLIQFAVSRTREYAADATAARITHNPLALAAALKKISADARVETLDKAPHMATACIASPLADEGNVAFFGLGKTHPDIDDRIARLEQMAASPVVRF